MKRMDGGQHESKIYCDMPVSYTHLTGNNLSPAFFDVVYMTKNAGCHVYHIKKGWAKIVSGKVKGYVKASYLTTDEKAEKLATKVGRECVEIQTDSLRVRALPSTSAPIYSVVSEGEEFTMKEGELTLDYVKKIVKKQKISKDAIKRAGGYEAMQEQLKDFICIYVDDDYAFVAKDFVRCV